MQENDQTLMQIYKLVVDLSMTHEPYIKVKKKTSGESGNRIEISKTKIKILPNMKMTPMKLRNVQKKLHVKNSKEFTCKVGKFTRQRLTLTKQMMSNCKETYKSNL